MTDTFEGISTFVAVAEAGSFRLAAERLGVTRSAVSQGLQRLEDRLGTALVQRTTRSVRLTEAGEQLYQTVSPALSEVKTALRAVQDERGRPTGTLRISVSSIAETFLSGAALTGFLQAYPGIRLDLTVTDEEDDIVQAGFDAGVRLGETVAQDMVAVRIGPEMRMAAVASPAYFAAHPPPRDPHELAAHRCINLRFPTLGGLYAWEFEKPGRALNVRVEGQLIVNEIALAFTAARDGLGIAYLPEDYVQPEIDAGRLERVLADWCPPFPGYHLYYPSRRQQSQAFALLVGALRHRG